jgi:hypothetical protein
MMNDFGRLEALYRELPEGHELLAVCTFITTVLLKII